MFYSILFGGIHDDVIKWKYFTRYWPFVRGIHWSPVDSPHKGQWRGALMFSLICAWTNGWANTRDTGNLRRHCAHYDVIVMINHEAKTAQMALSHALMPGYQVALRPVFIIQELNSFTICFQFIKYQHCYWKFWSPVIKSSCFWFISMLKLYVFTGSVYSIQEFVFLYCKTPTCICHRDCPVPSTESWYLCLSHCFGMHHCIHY